MMKIEAKNRGTHLDELLREDGIFDDLSTIVTKERIVWLLEKEMKKKKLSKVKMAQAMNTSRAQLDRLLDPKSGNVTLATMQKAANAVGKSLRVELV
jgi:antitoxin HicB